MYYLDPTITVGAQRISYWASNLHLLIPNTSVEVITAVRGEQALPNVNRVHVVPNRNLGRLTIDAGYSWRRDLLNYIRAMRFDFDWVIISGGPFMHFGIARQLKSQYNTKVLLDFRDPFARNPRFNNSFLTVAIKSFFERRFIEAADQIVTVNDRCVELLRHKGIPASKYTVIQNGYDEMAIEAVLADRNQSDSTVDMIYSGSFFDDRNPVNMLKVLGKDNHKEIFSFTHVGRPSAYVDSFKDQENVHQLGLMTYKKTLEQVMKADIGLIFTSGKAFESTTKIFDYIGLGKVIIIVTNGGLRTGSLHEITEQYPKVYWSKNDEDSIGVVLNEIKDADLDVSFPNKDDYSRYAGLKKLESLINIEPQ